MREPRRLEDRSSESFDRANYERALHDIDNDGNIDFAPVFGHTVLNRADGNFDQTIGVAHPAIPKGYVDGLPQFTADFDGDVDLIATSDPGYARDARTEIFWNRLTGGAGAVRWLAG